jgi:hypothetical protein
MDHLKDPILSSVCALAPVCGGQQLELANLKQLQFVQFSKQQISVACDGLCFVLADLRS